jgi:hypothetical protein
MSKKRPCPLYIRIYVLSQKCVEYISIFLAAFVNGFWLGVLNRERLHAINEMHYYQTSKMYCDENYNKSGLRHWESEMVERYFKTCKSLLVAGVGGGREVLALQKLGYEVDGFECYEPFVSFAQELLKKENCIPSVRLAPRDQCPINGQIYDGLIIGWGAYMCIQGRELRINFLKNMRAQARDGSPILLSFFARPRDGRYLKTILMIGNSIRWFLRKDALELGDDLYPPHYVHHFTKKEIISDLRDAGFELKFYSSKSYGHAVGVAV